MKTEHPSCPIERVVALFGDSCSILIMRDLLERPLRFGELQRCGASTRTLSKKLRQLRSEGLIAHAAGSGAPLYRLTKKGMAFNEVAEAMRRYGKKYL